MGVENVAIVTSTEYDNGIGFFENFRVFWVACFRINACFDKTAFIKYYKEFCDKDENPSLTDSVLFYALDLAQKMAVKFVYKINLYSEWQE